MTGEKRRHQIFVDRKLQGALLAHTAIYWFYCLFSVTLIAVCWIIFTQQPDSSAELFTQLWLNCGPALLGSVLLLPLVLLDCLRLSSRFAGPMVRMQRAMRDLAAGQTPPALVLRPGDYWADFADNMNVAIQRLGQQQLPPEAAQSPLSIDSDDPVVQPSSDVAESNFDAPLGPPIAAPLEADAPAQNIYSDLSI